MLATIFIDIFNGKPQTTGYALSPAAQSIIPTPSQTRGASLKYDPNSSSYQYNAGYSPSGDVGGTSPGPKFTAKVAADLYSKGMTVTDPVNDVSVSLIPQFATKSAEQNSNQLVYPIVGYDAQKVYTFGAAAVKEDIVFNSNQGDTARFSYALSLSNGTEARLEKNGDLAIYGVNPTLLGNITTGTAKDAALLEKARQNGVKNYLLFTLPKPVVLEYGKSVSSVKAWFSLSGSVLVVHASGLAKASYPLTIDPSVYIETAQKLMQGNNETNIDFDVTNELIQKSQTTGARIDSWTSTNNLSTPVWGQGTATAGGYIYSAGGKGGAATYKSTYYTAGSFTYTVPAGVTSLTVKVWGAGGGGGTGANSTGTGGAGGGGGYAKSVLTVTPGANLTLTVGSGGTGGSGAAVGGNGGGYSSVQSGSTFLLQAGGGGGGGAAQGSSSGNGGAGGAGGGATAVPGSSGGNSGAGGGGGAGTASGGGAGGTAGTSGAAGVRGIANAGGDAGASTGTCNASVSGTGGAGGYGAGGKGGNDTTSCGAGGGGGSGRYGGGGGGSVNRSNRGGGGGGGGSSLATGASQVQTAGSGANPGNNTDTDWNNAGTGGGGTTANTSATSGSDGGIVVSYTAGSSSILSTVSWAKFNPTDKSIESPNPGNGACSGWCNNSVYNLPVALSGLSLVAYNGYLYAIGGSNSSGTPQTTVYIAKLGANGEPQLWHPTDSNKANWVYWYSDTALANARSFFGAVAYNNHMYILGGLTTSSTVLSSNTVQYATINPNGLLTGWTSSGMQALSSARYGLTAQVYNGYVYVIGGDTTFTGTPVSTVEYARLNTDGTMNSWQTTTNLSTSGRMTMGGSFSTIWGAYVYVAGGCTAVNASGYCTSIASDVQLASINADGSLDTFNTILNLSNARIGHTLIAWQGGLYRLGGCRAQDSGTGACNDTVFDVDYGVINQEGDASTVATSVASNQSPCNATTPTNCDIPSDVTYGTPGYIGDVLNGTVLLNGYLYIMGGCTSNACTSYSRGVAYSAIGSDGSLTAPASCGTWSRVTAYCYNTTSLPNALGAPATTVFGGRIYLIGGFPSITNITYAAPNSDGSISSWSNTDTTSIGASDVSYAFAYARANPASAGTNPGNLYILGGCTAATGIGCSSYTNAVYKCNINTSGVPSGCTTSGQLQINNTGDTSTGLGAMVGAVYANYIYLVGGLTPNITDLKTTIYAKFDNSNNIVAVSGGSWVRSPNLTYFGRRRGAGIGYNGYLYVVGGYDGTTGGGVLADIEFAKINVSDGSIGTWSVSEVNINQRWGLNVIVSNSYAYVIGGCITGAAPSSCTQRTDTIQTFQIYNNNSGAVDTYSTGNTIGVDRIGGSSTVYNGYLYYAGGCSDMACTTPTANTYYAALDSYGNIGSWSSGGALPAARAWGQLLNSGGTLYYVGGQTGSATTTAVSTVYYTSGISSGNPTWNASAATKGIGDTGAGGQARTQFGAAAWDGRIYVVGGYSSGGTTQSTVYVSPQMSGGGNITSNWASSSAFNVARAGLTVVAYANNLYVLGGYDGSNYLSDTQYASIGYKTGTISQSGTTVTGSGTSFTSAMVGKTLQYPDGSTATITAYGSGTSLTVNASKSVSAGTIFVVQDGSVGSWLYSTSLPSAIRDASGFASNGYIYLVSGRTAATTCSPSTLLAPISANTTIATGNNPTGVGDWFQTNVRYTGDRYGATTAYSGGRMYLLGGGCSSFVSSTDRTYYSTLKSQPQVAQYSRLIDTDTDVFPTKWLINGLDNSIGARWQLTYSTMTDPLSNGGAGTKCSVAKMTTWGVATNYGNVTLGSPQTYTPLDGSGANTNCARYFYLSISIDASQTFGYPEDVTRGPTISDISLFYTADPSKRLLHGKTFTGGLQQPLDTPF